ncbi:CueP family metal-binding protein [Paraliobacillus sp. JSM ZJ581]|uniref:CueP family metal-binding protein n=1 Tax=Paraliobacillus sp. JSM ZJ581 TaxID=3342118 RepID=UPI0035A91F4E
MKQIRMILFVAAIFVIGIGVYIYMDIEDKEEAIEQVDVKQLVADYSSNQTIEEAASITSDQLIVTNNDNNETTYQLPSDEFFVSIAPYVHKTHPCAVHSLTGCQGELANESFDIFIEDEEGNTMVDATMQAQANGFVDLWLPRDKKYDVTISYDGKNTTASISTFEGDNTCITTMQLA